MTWTREHDRTIAQALGLDYPDEVPRFDVDLEGCIAAAEKWRDRRDDWYWNLISPGCQMFHPGQYSSVLQLPTRWAGRGHADTPAAALAWALYNAVKGDEA